VAVVLLCRCVLDRAWGFRPYEEKNRVAGADDVVEGWEIRGRRRPGLSNLSGRVRGRTLQTALRCKVSFIERHLLN
jgi:hypothetical protein